MGYMFPLYINSIFLTLLMAMRLMHPNIESSATEYMYVAGPMLNCHNALIQYADAHPTTFGTISASAVDAFLPPGTVDPGYFTYVITAPGTVDTYLTSPTNFPDPAAIVLLTEDLSGNTITAGYVSSGQITTNTGVPPVAAAASVPAGAYVIQTTLRIH
jgi:hypothetical protein